MSSHEFLVTNKESFKYQQLPFSSAIFAFLIGFFVFLSLCVAGKHGYVDEFLVFIAFVPFFSFWALMTAFGFSDVVISAEGVARKLYGWTWRSLKWSEIKLIRVLDAPVPTAQKTRTFIKLIPGQSNSKKKSRSIVIGKDIEMAGKLVTMLNTYIIKYKIPVENVIEGVSTKSDHL